MFDISGWEFITLAIIAVIVFGPERLPKFAADAGKFVRTVRGYVNGAKADLTRELGPEFADVKVSDLTPRGILRKTLGDDPFADVRDEVDITKDFDDFKSLRGSMLVDRPGAAKTLTPGEAPPFDPDTT